MLDRRPQLSPSAAARRRRRERKARYRRRQATGTVCLRVEVLEHDLADALLRSGRLTPDQALQRGEIEQALALIVADFVARWARVPC